MQYISFHYECYILLTYFLIKMLLFTLQLIFITIITLPLLLKIYLQINVSFLKLTFISKISEHTGYINLHCIICMSNIKIFNLDLLHSLSMLYYFPFLYNQHNLNFNKIIGVHDINFLSIKVYCYIF